MSAAAFAIPNKHGAFSQHQTIRGKGDGWRVEIHIAQAGKDDWRSSYDLSGHGFGAGSWPSIYDKKFQDRDGAILDAIQNALRQIKNWEKSNVQDCAQMKKWLLLQLQPRLF
jgi:hypothetical protein